METIKMKWMALGLMGALMVGGLSTAEAREDNRRDERVKVQQRNDRFEANRHNNRNAHAGHNHDHDRNDNLRTARTAAGIAFGLFDRIADRFDNRHDHGHVHHHGLRRVWVPGHYDLVKHRNHYDRVWIPGHYEWVRVGHAHYPRR